MPRPIDDPAVEGRRVKAWHLYLGDLDGKRRSMRSIALELGVSNRAVQYWREKDGWDAKLDEVLTKKADAEAKRAEEVTGLLQRSLSEHVLTLNKVIRGAKKDADKIKGIVAFVDIYRKLGVPLNPLEQAKPLGFSDEIGVPGERPGTPDLLGPERRGLEPEPAEPSGASPVDGPEPVSPSS